jgi:hypothetical protein
MDVSSIVAEGKQLCMANNRIIPAMGILFSKFSSYLLYALVHSNVNANVNVNVSYDGYCKFLEDSQPTSLSDYVSEKPFYIQDSRDCDALEALGLIERTNKIIVISTHTPLKPFLIKLQKKSLDLFMIEPFVHIVYGANMKDEKELLEMKSVAEKVGTNFRRIPMEVHKERRCLFPETKNLGNDYSTRACDTFQYMFRDATTFCSKSLVLELDADVMLIRPLNVTFEIGSSNVAGLEQSRRFKTEGLETTVRYLWSPVVFFNMNGFPGRSDFNFDVGGVEVSGIKISETELYLDAGGMTYSWMAKHRPTITWLEEALLTDVRFSKHIDVEKFIPRLKQNKMMGAFEHAQILGGKFIHLRNAGGWKGNSTVSGATTYQIISRFIADADKAYGLNRTHSTKT